MQGAIAMTSIPLADNRVTSLLDGVRGYLIRYRLAFYLLSAAAVVLGIVLNWSWLTVAGLFRVLAVLPCALTMFSCVRYAARAGLLANATGIETCQEPIERGES
jgi:hypothetical protein